jgi:hypothetical protein
MRRRHASPLLAMALAVLVAASPAASSADHDVALTPGDSVTVDGGPTGGINYTPIVTGGTQPEPTCAKTPDAWCESTLVELSADVPADAARGRLMATFAMTLNATQPVSDFDVFIYASDEAGERGARLTSSGSLLGGQIAPVQDGILYRCPDSDECAELSMTFRDGDEPQYVLVEVHYAVAPVSYVMDLSLS